jgi:hypothetical protein
MALLFAAVHMSAFGARRTTHYLLAGDATYAEKFLKADQVDGVTYDPAVSLLTQQRISDPPLRNR